MSSPTGFSAHAGGSPKARLPLAGLEGLVGLVRLVGQVGRAGPVGPEGSEARAGQAVPRTERRNEHRLDLANPVRSRFAQRS